MKKPYPYWIKERHNPQLGVYYVPMGRLSKNAAILHESTLYGVNVMIRYETEEAYKAKLKELEESGERIQL